MGEDQAVWIQRKLRMIFPHKINLTEQFDAALKAHLQPETH